MNEERFASDIRHRVCYRSPGRFSRSDVPETSKSVVESSSRPRPLGRHNL